MARANKQEREFAEAARDLCRTYAGPSRHGFAVFLTGLSGAGKSTIANALLAKCIENGNRTITLLDGDGVRRLLSSELGFSKADRDTNIRRIGFVASEIAKHGGIAICAAIAPFDQARKEIRTMVTEVGTFVLVHVSTPLAVCEQRDPKGLYVKARAGIIRQFTGISDPYELPTDAEITVDATHTTPNEATEIILRYVTDVGLVSAPVPAP
jgi:sulfate adenylyltransferase